MVSLRELDLRAAKKQVCKITPELVAALKERFCKVRGGVIKKAKGGKKAKPGAATTTASPAATALLAPPTTTITSSQPTAAPASILP